MDFNNYHGFSLIELIMMIAIIAILAVPGAYILMYLLKNSVFIPNKLNMDMLASDAFGSMIEGDSVAKGLRFSKSITAVADNQITFNNQTGQSIIYRLDTVANRLYRSINGAAETLLPYYIASGVTMTGKSNKLFTYYDASEVVTAVPANVRWITMSLIAKTGTGLYQDWQGQTDQTTSIAVKKFQ